MDPYQLFFNQHNLKTFIFKNQNTNFEIENIKISSALQYAESISA